MRLALAVAVAIFAGTAAAAGDAARGKAIYARCTACHALEYDRVGPRHCGLLGRKAGALAGFGYSDAMKNSRLVWNAKSLDRFLADPVRTVPGTTMTYAGVPAAQDRADLIAYLAAAKCERKRASD